MEPDKTNDKVAVPRAKTILIVADDEAVRSAILTLLTDLGYQVLTATNHWSASAIVESGAAIDLLFSDVAAADHKSNIDFATQTKAIVPDIELLMTLVGDSVFPGAAANHGIEWITQPYTPAELGSKIHALLSPAVIIQHSPASRDPALKNAEHLTLRARFLHVLLVEDNVMLQQTTAALVRELGHEVTVTDSAEQAIETLRQGRFDVLITDVSLPGMSGVDLVRIAHARHPILPIIITSGYADRFDQALPIYAQLTKPYDGAEMEQLLGRIAEAIG